MDAALAAYGSPEHLHRCQKRPVPHCAGAPRAAHLPRSAGAVSVTAIAPAALAIAASARAGRCRRCYRHVAARTLARGRQAGAAEYYSGSQGQVAGRIGVVLLNIGTPVSCSLEDVTDYLRRFLWDDRVVEIKDPEAKQEILQKILRSGSAKSAESYRQIWHPSRGSPLLYHTEDLADGLRQELGEAYEVCIGFQYSEPSVETALARLLSLAVDKVVLVPMYPHFAEATVGAFLANTCRVAADLRCTTYLQVLPPFYKSPGFLEAASRSIAEVVGPRGRSVDHVVFSFHGIPEGQCTRTDETESVCMKSSDCCSKVCEANRNCYRAQCFETAALLASLLELPCDRWSLAFASRKSVRGAIAWTKPFTDVLLPELAGAGKRCVAVCSPSYTADCIETLGLLGKDGRELFLGAGGDELVLAPCVNSSATWVQNLADMIREMPGTAADATRSTGKVRSYWAM